MTIRLEPSKRPEETRRYRHVWTPFLGTDTIVSEDTVGEGVTVATVIEAGEQSVKFTVSGGELNVPGRIIHTITTFAGDVETEEFLIDISGDEPVSLTDAKAQCRMANDDSEDSFIASLIPSARAYVERVTRYFFVAAAREETFSAWGDYLEIHRRPVTGVTSISYVDENGAEVEVASVDPAVVPDGFLAPLGRFPFRIYPGVNEEFPALATGGTITVSYTSGSLSPSSEEYLIGRRAMLLLIGHWFEFREAAATGIVSGEIAFALTSMLDELRPVSAY